jgi:hypothetical protein
MTQAISAWYALSLAGLNIALTHNLRPSVAYTCYPFLSKIITLSCQDLPYDNDEWQTIKPVTIPP